MKLTTVLTLTLLAAGTGTSLAGTVRDHRGSSSSSASSASSARDHRDSSSASSSSTRDHRSSSSDSGSSRDHRGSSSSSSSSGSTRDHRGSDDTSWGSSSTSTWDYSSSTPTYWQGPRLDKLRFELDSFFRRVDRETTAGVGGRIIAGNRFAYIGAEIAGGTPTDPAMSTESLLIFGAVGGFRAPLSPNFEIGVEGFFGGQSYREDDAVLEGRLKAQYRVLPVMSVGGYIGSNMTGDRDGSVVGIQLGFHARRR